MHSNRCYPFRNLIASSMIVFSVTGCSSLERIANSQFGNVDRISLNASESAEAKAVNAAMNAVEDLYQHALSQELAYYAPLNFAAAETQHRKLLTLYEDYDPAGGSWFSNSGSDEILATAELFIQRINRALQAKLITEPRLQVIRDHDMFIAGLDSDEFSSRLAKITKETQQFVGQVESKGTAIGLEHKQAKLERDYKALERDIVKRNITRLPTAEFNLLEQDIAPESYKRALHELYRLERLIEKNPRDSSTIEQQLNISYNYIKQAESIAQEVIWVKARVQTSAERVVLSYRNHLNLLNQFLGTEDLMALDFQSQIRGIQDAIATRLSKRDQQSSQNELQLRRQIAELARLLTGQDMRQYSMNQQVDSILSTVRALADESVTIPLAQRQSRQANQPLY